MQRRHRGVVLMGGGVPAGELSSPEGSRRVSDYPALLVEVNHVEPVPRRVRATLRNVTIVDSTRALYVWETPYYPQYYIPLDDVASEALDEEEEGTQDSSRGEVSLHALRVGDLHRPRAAKVLKKSKVDGLSDTVRFEWSALDAWFEEDERVFVHPRNPYIRVDALRSTRKVRVELDGVVLAESSSPVMVFETGLPTRYYINPTEVNFSHLFATDTTTECPYKGTANRYWSLKIGDEVHTDLAWAYDFPVRELQPIAGMIAFYNERVDIFVDGDLQERPSTLFFKSKS
jgi:uncharacterized protein (DUF427 family)